MRKVRDEFILNRAEFEKIQEFMYTLSCVARGDYDKQMPVLSRSGIVDAESLCDVMAKLASGERSKVTWEPSEPDLEIVAADKDED